jgi:hypothetical protein
METLAPSFVTPLGAAHKKCVRRPHLGDCANQQRTHEKNNNAKNRSKYMRHIQDALIATAVIGLAALTASAADAQYYAPRYGAYGYAQPYYGGSYYSYGADRSNPSLSPHGYDQDNPRDQQLQGHN